MKFDLSSPSTCPVGSLWRDAYEPIAIAAAERHFGGMAGITRTFPTMRDDYPWSEDRPAVSDSRVPAKNAFEYHGVERHGWQWFSTAQYEEARDHWVMAAGLRRADMLAQGFTDTRHVRAIDHDLRLAAYADWLFEEGWRDVSFAQGLPSAASFGLTDESVRAGVVASLTAMKAALAARGAPDPGFEIPA